jgi:hypothetical protein
MDSKLQQIRDLLNQKDEVVDEVIKNMQEEVETLEKFGLTKADILARLGFGASKPTRKVRTTAAKKARTGAATT